MKYYADYWNECVYSISENGDATGKNLLANGQVNIVKFKRPDDLPWAWEENGVGSLIETMTKIEFDSFGKSWKWSNIPNEAEKKSHSWRNYIMKL